MERETTSASEAPLELLNGAGSHHKGLRHVELQQVRGAKGYAPIDGARWRFKNDDGEECSHEDRPSTAAREIALALYAAAVDTRRSNHDQRFCAVFHNVEHGGSVRPSKVKFEVVLADGASGSPQNVAEAEAIAHVSMLAEMRTMISDLHNRLETQATRQNEAAVKSNESVEKIANNVSDGIAKLTSATVTAIVSVANVLPMIVNARLDAAEHEAEAIRAIASAQDDGKASEWWTQRAKDVVEIVKSPAAIAVAAKAFGMDPDEIMKLVNAQNANAQPSIRVLVQQLGVSLTPEQQTRLGAGMGQKLMKLKGVGTTSDDATATTMCAEFFSSLTKADWHLLAEQLDDAQGQLVEQIAVLARASVKK